MASLAVGAQLVRRAHREVRAEHAVLLADVSPGCGTMAVRGGIGEIHGFGGIGTIARAPAVSVASARSVATASRAGGGAMRAEPTYRAAPDSLAARSHRS